VAVQLVCPWAAIWVAAPAVTVTGAVCVIATVLIVAEIVFPPVLVELNVAVRTPVVGSVVPVAGVSVLPVPPVAVRNTLAPPIVLPPASRAVTLIVLVPDPAGIDGGAAPTVDVVADTGPTVPVAVNVTGLPLIPDPVAVAVSVFVPAVGASVQLPTVAIPSVPVVGFEPVTLPPLEGAKVTATPETRLPLASRTITEGGGVTAVPAVADVPPPFGAIEAAVPAPSAIAPEVAGVSPPPPKLSV